jgi:Holliday junction resolvasome RuvABC DNA-binding subunit
MATIRQKRLAENMVLTLKEKKKETFQDLLVASGYSLTTAKKQAGIIIQREGVQKELERLGFNEETVKGVVAEILLSGKNSDRLKAADMIFKYLGSYAPEKKAITTANFVDLINRLDKYEDVN